ncbi:MAG: hypothetical protein LKM36_10340 [Flavobacteriales bacterium]|jgi:hypothetical protein|nr:hypothetical protein [Flavobacteriales bacterium]
MWPILTLSFLLQLTDEEQLFAQQAMPVLQPTTEQCDVADAIPVENACPVAWPNTEDEAV